jgi:hypothetical protein
MISNSSLFKFIFYLSVLLLFSITFLMLPRGDDYDLWWHLQYGKHFIENSTWSIDHSMFSWTASKPDWKYMTWIGSSLLYLVYCFSSTEGLCLLHIVTIIGIYLIFFIYLKINAISPKIWHIALMMFIPLTLSNILLKPEFFSFLFFTICIFIYFHSLNSARSFYVIYPFLFFIWANTHGLFLFGFIYIVLVLFCDTISFIRNKSDVALKKRIIALAFFLVISFAATLINPYGIHYYYSMLTSVSDNNSYMHNILAFSNLWKFLFTDSNQIKFISTAWYAIILLLAFCIAFLYARQHNKTSYYHILLPIALFFLIGMSMSRATILFNILCIFSIFHLMKNYEISSVEKKLSYFALCFVVVFTFLFFRTQFVLEEKKTWLGIGYNQWMPEREAAFILENKLPGPIFNDYLIGGYMIWKMYPDYKVFIDPRYTCYDDYVIRDYFGLYTESDISTDKFHEFHSKYNFNTIFLHLSEFKTISFLLKSTEWKLVYFDTNAIIFLHRSQYGSIKNGIKSDSLSASRFHSLDDPMSLLRIFDIYAHLYAINDMKIIRDYYITNVSSLYASRNSNINAMNRVIIYVGEQLLKTSPQ